MPGMNRRKLATAIAVPILALALAVGIFLVFFDEAVFLRKGTVYRGPSDGNAIALTFDDGPSPIWTPKILDELKALDVKATFFVLGKHAEQYPEILKRMAAEGHEIENHTYDHHVLIYYKESELETELGKTDEIVKNITGKKTRYFRPPKAWLTAREKRKVNAMGYRVVLWSLNSKDWVTFDDKYIVKFLMMNVRPGDLILFHDSGGVFGTEGGNREETVLTVQKLVPKLQAKGYRFVTVSELLGDS